MDARQNNISGYILLLLAQLMVGVCIVGSKALLGSMQPVTILSVRFVIGFLFLMAFHLMFSKDRFHVLYDLKCRDWFYIVAQALCAGALFNILLLFGLKYTTASVAGIITSALPAIVAIFSVVFLKERLTFFTVLCILFAVTGLIIINAHSLHAEGNRIYGDIIILISLLPEAAYYVLSKVHKNRLPVFLISSLMNGINIPIFLLFIYFGSYPMPISLTFYQVSLLFIVGIGSALFYVFWFLGCKNVHGVAAGLSTAFMPITTLLIAWVFLHETISLFQFGGMALVILSIFINARKYAVT